MNDDSIEVHGAHVYDATGAISEPIYLSATYRHPGFRQSTGYDYGRCANPTRAVLEKTLAMLERGERAWGVASGMAAVNIVLMLLAPGDHVVFGSDLYGGTVRLANEVYRRYGIEASYVDTSRLDCVEAALRPETKLVFIETPSNPMMLVSDIEAIAKLSHAHGALLAVDNTFLSPHFQKPLTLGADIVVHSGTKYLCGHNDVRVERQAANALAIASWLRTQPRVQAVYYPGLPDHPGHALQERQATGSGGMVSFKVESAALAQAMLGRVSLISFAESLGGVETLLTYPRVQTHAEMPEELLRETGLDDTLLRLSVGIEDVHDLISDLDHALRD